MNLWVLPASLWCNPTHLPVILFAAVPLKKGEGPRVECQKDERCEHREMLIHTVEQNVVIELRKESESNCSNTVYIKCISTSVGEFSIMHFSDRKAFVK